MAIDTREKRASAAVLLLLWYPPGIEPGSLDTTERRAAGYAYASDFGGGGQLGAVLFGCFLLGRPAVFGSYLLTPWRGEVP